MKRSGTGNVKPHPVFVGTDLLETYFSRRKDICMTDTLSNLTPPDEGDTHNSSEDEEEDPKVEADSKVNPSLARLTVCFYLLKLLNCSCALREQKKSKKGQ